jgi:hypothetical protein
MIDPGKNKPYNKQKKITKGSFAYQSASKHKDEGLSNMTY